MDFLDPRKQRAHTIRLIVGYILIGLAILIATAILLYRAYGFGLDKDGEVVQSGLIFVSSQPDGADIFLDNKLYKDTTGARLQLPEGSYAVDVKKDGYRTWRRSVAVAGGSVSRYDYPLLIPNTLTPTALKNYAAEPGFASQSPDRRWLIINQPGAVLNFDVYDLADPKKVSEKAKNFALPAALISSAGTGNHSWKLAEWSTDNRNVVLEHTYAGGIEYILVDHEQPERSLNLTRSLELTAGQVLSLHDKKFDKYYVFDPAAKTVSTTSLDENAVQTPVLTNALAFKSYSKDILLYATDAEAPAGMVTTMLRDGDVTYKLREMGSGAPYLLDLARYDDDWYVAVGASIDNKVYVFKNPQAVRKAARVQNLVPVQILRVTAPNYLAFSSNTRFVMIENATSFAVYDAETDKGYTYTTPQPLDAGQAHATWMDGHRLTYVSGGKSIIFDYDNLNAQTLVASSPAFLPYYDRDYRYLYTFTPPAANGQSILTGTSLLIEQDR
mgnify:CR=1 FL=1